MENEIKKAIVRVTDPIFKSGIETQNDNIYSDVLQFYTNNEFINSRETNTENHYIKNSLIKGVFTNRVKHMLKLCTIDYINSIIFSPLTKKYRSLDGKFLGAFEISDKLELSFEHHPYSLIYNMDNYTNNELFMNKVYIMNYSILISTLVYNSIKYSTYVQSPIITEDLIEIDNIKTIIARDVGRNIVNMIIELISEYNQSFKNNIIQQPIDDIVEDIDNNSLVLDYITLNRNITTI